MQKEAISHLNVVEKRVRTPACPLVIRKTWVPLVRTEARPLQVGGRLAYGAERQVQRTWMESGRRQNQVVEKLGPRGEKVGYFFGWGT